MKAFILSVFTTGIVFAIAAHIGLTEFLICTGGFICGTIAAGAFDSL